jgi:hypothetical protein
VGEVEMVLRVKGTSWAGVGWRPRDLTAACKKFPVLADPPPAAEPDAETTAGPQGRSLGSVEAAVAEPETEPEPEAAPGNEAALERALESEGVAGGQQQAARNTRYGVHFIFVPLF